MGLWVVDLYGVDVCGLEVVELGVDGIVGCVGFVVEVLVVE